MCWRLHSWPLFLGGSALVAALALAAVVLWWQLAYVVPEPFPVEVVARELAPRFRARGNLDLAVRVGINRGMAVVGGIGTSQMTQYTVVGAVVNQAQRLEAACTPGCVLLSHEVAAELPVLAGATPVIAGQGVNVADRTVRPKGFVEDLHVTELSLVAGR